MRMAIVIGGLVLAHVAIPARAEACVCAAYPETPTRAQLKADVAYDLKESFAVFSGSVIAVDLFTVRFRVERSWKGKLGQVIEFSTGRQRTPDGSISMSSCDYSFTPGMRYVVFATGTSVKTMQAGQCGGTQPLTQAADTLIFLDELRGRK